MSKVLLQINTRGASYNMLECTSITPVICTCVYPFVEQAMHAIVSDTVYQPY